MDVNLRLQQLAGVKSQTYHHLGGTLLLVNSSFTPRPELLCMILLYSPSSSSEVSKNEAAGEAGDFGGGPCVAAILSSA